jgi:hypothetical protein
VSLPPDGPPAQVTFPHAGASPGLRTVSTQHHLPSLVSELRTARLLLRQRQPSDFDPFARLNAGPEVRRFFPALLTRRKSDALAHRERMLIAERGWGLWVKPPGDNPKRDARSADAVAPLQTSSSPARQSCTTVQTSPHLRLNVCPAGAFAVLGPGRGCRARRRASARAALVGGIHLFARLGGAAKQLKHRLMTAGTCKRLRGRLGVATNPSIGSGIDVHPRKLEIAHLRGLHQRREAIALL